MKKSEKSEELRQTDCSFNDLVRMLDSNGEPRCLLVNEIGVILLCQGEEAPAAESFLIGLLEKEDEHEKMLACCYLLTSKISASAREKLTQFENAIANEKILARVRAAIN